ncbi:MAG: hypothetical protein NVV73_23050 [Cellvibrionaceae bacterium]|nr:hypothetical protein [Cellvibrionaceae bacterium]
MPPENPNSRPQIERAIKALEILASLATIIGVFGLFFIYKQVKVNEEEIALSSLNEIYAQMVDIDKVFLENPEARLYIYSNIRPEDLRPDASPAQYQLDQATAMAAAELMLDFFAQVTLVLPKLGDAGESWVTYIKDVYKCSPVLRERYEIKYDWYKYEEAAEIINQAKDEMQKGKVQCDTLKKPAI